MALAGLGPGHSGDQRCGEQRPVGPQDQHTRNHTRPEAVFGGAGMLGWLEHPGAWDLWSLQWAGGTWSAFLGW